MNQPSPTSSDDQNNNPQQIDPDIPSQEPKETALQKSNQEVARPTKSNMLSSKENREAANKQLNQTITKYVETSLRFGKKKARSRVQCPATSRDLEASNA